MALASGLTINQEKQLRQMRTEHPTLRAHEMSRLSLLETLAQTVAQYRRATKLSSKEASDLRRELLETIDECLLKLGFR